MVVWRVASLVAKMAVMWVEMAVQWVVMLVDERGALLVDEKVAMKAEMSGRILS